MAATPRIIVVGGGLAGLAAVIKIAEAGGKVDLFSIVPVKRSHSVCAQGGINAAKNLKGEGDDVFKHFDDTIYGGDFLANQTPVKNMTAQGPAIIDLLDRMGVPFNRTPEGLLDFRRFGGTLYHRTAFAGATTGQQLLYALDEQVRRYEAEGKVTKYEGWEFLSAVLDSKGACRGITAMDLRTMETRTFPADAIIVCTGGNGAIFGKSTNSVVCTGSAQSALYQQGAYYANGEFIQVHPTAIPGEDKLRLMSESARGEGGRVWVPKDKNDKRAAQIHPRIRPLVLPRRVVPQVRQPRPPRRSHPRHLQGRLRARHGHRRPAHGLPRRLPPFARAPAQARRHPRDLREVRRRRPPQSPHEDLPRHALHHGRPLGRLQPADEHPRRIRRRRSRLLHPRRQPPRRQLPPLLHLRRLRRRPACHAYAKSLPAQEGDGGHAAELQRQKEFNNLLLNNPGTENPFKLWRELGDTMTKHATIIRYNAGLDEADAKIVELLDRYRNVNLSDKSQWANTSFAFTRQLWNMLQLGRVIVQGARLRDESRGAHYKPDFPDRNDEKFLKTTKATFKDDAPAFELEEVDISHIKPRPRRYDATA